MQFDLFGNRPNAQRDLEAVLDSVARSRERKADTERAKLRKKREELLDQKSVGVESLRCAVKEAEGELAAAKEKVRFASRKLAQAERELSEYAQSFDRQIGRIEVELLRRPIGRLTELRKKVGRAKYHLGASPTWGMDAKQTVDLSYWRKAERLAAIENEIEQLEEKDSSMVDLVASSIEKRIEFVLR